MEDDFQSVFSKSTDLKALFGVPMQRAAYSDRTAHLMACLAQAAYYRFEGGTDFVEWVTDLVAIRDDLTEDKAKELLSKFAAQVQEKSTANRDKLEAGLRSGGFKLLETIEDKPTDTQGFLALRDAKNPKNRFLVLAFRGTEPKKWKDWKTDFKGRLIEPMGGRPDERVHEGFHDAFQAVTGQIKDALAEHGGPPIYTTGHSLGGALAVLATRFIAKDSQGACYTFGAPRVGNDKLDDIMFTPIYRVVHGADAVARVPPSKWYFRVFSFLVDFVPLWREQIRAAVRWINLNFGGYIHFGDMRYINTEGVASDKLGIHSNPHLLARLYWLGMRLISTKGAAAIGDHSMSLYRRKLRQHAINRYLRAMEECKAGETPPLIGQDGDTDSHSNEEGEKP